MGLDFGSLVLRKGLGAMASERPRCSACRRTPLTGERLHQLETRELLCDLCLARLPEHRREPVRSDRVPAGERRLAVASRGGRAPRSALPL